MLIRLRDWVMSVGDTNKEVSMSHSDKIELWRSEAETISDPKPIGLPLDVLVGESVEVAKFLRKYWVLAAT